VISDAVQKALDTPRECGEQLQEIVTSKSYAAGDRNMLLLGYWELVSDFHQGIHALVKSEFFASAFTRTAHGGKFGACTRGFRGI
jgi:hypothetical protein